MVHSTIVIGVFWSYRIGSTALPSCNFHRSQWPWLPVRKLLETGGYIEKWAILSHTYIDYIRYTYIYIYIHTCTYIHIIYIYIPICVQFSNGLLATSTQIHLPNLPSSQPPAHLVELFLVHGPWGQAIVWHGRVGDLLGEHLGSGVKNSPGLALGFFCLQKSDPTFGKIHDLTVLTDVYSWKI